MDLQAIYHALRNKRRHLTIRTIFKSPSNTGIITRSTSSGDVITEERPVERQSRTGEDLTPEPLFDAPNRYAQRRPCTCKTHEGNRWRPLSEFSTRKAKNGKSYPLSWCNACRAAYQRHQYNLLRQLAP